MFNNENGIAGFKLFQLLSFCIQKFKAKITLLEIEKKLPPRCQAPQQKHHAHKIYKTMQIRKAWGISPVPPPPPIPLLHILTFL